MANDLIDPKKVKKEMEVMIDMITHPAFVAAMKAMKETPVAGRTELGKKSLTVKSLSAKGVKIPEGMRVTTRYFEPGKPTIMEMTPDGKLIGTKLPKFPIGDPGPLSWGGCACGGGLTFCGGAGGST